MISNVDVRFFNFIPSYIDPTAQLRCNLYSKPLKWWPNSIHLQLAEGKKEEGIISTSLDCKSIPGWLKEQ